MQERLAEEMNAVSVLESYFNGLKFTRAEYRKEFAIFAARVPSLYQTNNRYVFVMVDTTKCSYLPAGPVALEHLPWVALQTRLVSRDTDRYAALFQTPSSWRLDGRVRDAKLRIEDRSKKQSTYASEDNSLRAVLLHDASSKSPYQFHNNIMLSTAVETFKALFTKMDGLGHESARTLL